MKRQISEFDIIKYDILLKRNTEDDIQCQPAQADSQEDSFFPADGQRAVIKKTFRSRRQNEKSTNNNNGNIQN